MIGVNHLYSTLWKTKRDYQTQKRQVVTESVEKHSKRQENEWCCNSEKVLLKYIKTTTRSALKETLHLYFRKKETALERQWNTKETEC